MITGPLPSGEPRDYRSALDKAQRGERLIDMWACRRCDMTGTDPITPIRCPRCGSWSTGKLRFRSVAPVLRGNGPGEAGKR